MSSIPQRLAAAALPPALAALALWPASSTAATLLSSLVADLSVATTFSGGSFPPQEDAEEASRLVGGLGEVEAFVRAGPLPLPTQPTDVATGFASAQGDASGNFGVGVSSFFLVPPSPNAVAIAKGSFRQDIVNDSADTVTFNTDVFVPAPTIELGGQISDVGPGPTSPIIPTAEVQALVTTSITRLDGSREDATLLDYGLRVARDPVDGDFKPTVSRDAQGLTETDLGPFRFRFQLAALDRDFDAFAVLAPGESVIINFDYIARASNGVGETGYFAAIGDPFDIAGNGGHFAFSTVAGVDPPPPPPSAVPLPAALPLFALALAALAGVRRLRP